MIEFKKMKHKLLEELQRLAREPIFQDAYGNGKFNYDNKSFKTLADLEEYIKKETQHE